MNAKSGLIWIFGLAFVGSCFSGYLAVSEVFKKVCAFGTCTNVGGLPSCVYGFVVFLAIFIISWGSLYSLKGGDDEGKKAEEEFDKDEEDDSGEEQGVVEPVVEEENDGSN